MTAALDTPTGLLGRLNAMPTALRWMMYAAIGVLVRWGIEQYQQSLLYRGLAHADGPWCPGRSPSG